MRRKYVDLAEFWFDQYYPNKTTLMQALLMWWHGIEGRKSALLNFAEYLERLEE